MVIKLASQNYLYIATYIHAVSHNYILVIELYIHAFIFIIKNTAPSPNCAIM